MNEVEIIIHLHTHAEHFDNQKMSALHKSN